MQEVGKEFGATTGRRRRCGWLDLVQMRYSCLINGYTSLNLTKLDVLDTFEEIKVAVTYSLGGKKLSSFPADCDELEAVEIEYQTFAGWKMSISNHRSFEQLPDNAKKYIRFIEEYLSVPIKWIGVGPSREDMILREC